MTVRIGQMRRIVKIQNQVDLPDGRGGNKKTPMTVDRAWASVEPASANEQLLAGQEQHATMHRVTMRYNSFIEPSSRILLGDRVLEIDSVRNLGERDRYTQLICYEVAT